jgi:hypothetical protein
MRHLTTSQLIELKDLWDSVHDAVAKKLCPSRDQVEALVGY